MSMNRTNKSVVRAAALAAVAALGLLGGSAYGDRVGIGIGINIGVPPPPPPPVVVVEQPAVVVAAPVAVVNYDTYVVGGRRAVYDSDLRLRLAQTEEVRAQEALDAARHREGEVGVALDESEAGVNDLRAKLAGAAGDTAELRVRLGALEKRLQNAREDWDAAKVLHDPRGSADAERRFHENETEIAATNDQIRRVEEGAAARERLAAEEARRAQIRADLDGAHDGVFAAQERLTAAHEAVCLALHDRDEAMWLLYRDDIIVGRVRPEAVGFSINLAVFGGRMPRDPEILHAHFVHDVGFWRERPLEIETRIVAVDHVTEITRIREVQRVHEGPRINEVLTVEATFTPERRRAVAERVVVERQRVEVERVERKTAAAEGRRPNVDPREAAEAKAIVLKAKADAKSEVIGAKADAHATRQAADANALATKAQAHADAKSEVIGAHADSKSQVAGARADAKSEVLGAKGQREQAHANAEAAKVGAHADAKSEVIGAHADSKSQVAGARGDAKAEVIGAKAGRDTAQANAEAAKVQARADAKSQTTQSRSDARVQETRAKADAKATPPRPAPGAPKDPRTASNAPKDPRKPNPTRDGGTASTDDPSNRR